MLEIVTSVVLLLVGIAVLVIIHVCVAGRPFGMTQESTGRTTVAQRSTMSEDDIKKLPCYDYKLNREDEEDDDCGGGGSDEVRKVECAVCLEVFKVGDRCRLLPNCRHSFHAKCIDSWLIKNAACPICRSRVDLGRSRGAECKFPGDVCLELT
ncbi:putative transcription factor C2H2 family [Helianthus annuus]|nr:putative transcription factor C2H2 family [Helianthus annuus]